MKESTGAVVGLLILILVGCNQKEPVALDPETQEELADFDRKLDQRAQDLEQSRDRIHDPNVILARHSAEESPATLPPETDSGLNVQSQPEDVCREFLSSLQNGDRDAARELLTQAAQVATTRAQLELDAPGDQDTVFTVMQARYATMEKLVAEVDCLFHRRDYQGDSVKLTWMMRRQSNGWKIFGMLIDLGDGEVDLLSFENDVDLDRIQQSVGE